MMNPQYANQQYPAGYNPGYGASQAPQSFVGPPPPGQPSQGPPGQFGGSSAQNSMINGSNQPPTMPTSMYGGSAGKVPTTGPWMPAASSSSAISNHPPMSNAGQPVSSVGPSMSNGPASGFRAPGQPDGPMVMTRPPATGLPQPPNTGQLTNQIGNMTLASQQPSNPGTPVSSITSGSQAGPVAGLPNVSGTSQSVVTSRYPSNTPPVSAATSVPGSVGYNQPRPIGPSGVPHSMAGPQSSVANQFGGPPPQSGPGGMPPPQPGGMPPPQPGGMPPPQPGGMPPPQPGGMPPRPAVSTMLPQPGPGGMARQPGPGGMPPYSGGMPPQSSSSGMPPPPGATGMPPHSAGMPPHSAGMPPHSAGMPPQATAGGMPPQATAGGMPPQLGGMPPQLGGMPPQPGSMPPQPGGMPSQPGGMPPPPSPGGMPPQPGMGFQGVQSYHGGQLSGPMAPAQQQPRKLDPDQMPSPIQVIEDDRRNRSGEFIATQRHYLPPLVTTDFTAKDRGNTNPCMMRSTLSFVPCTADMLKQSSLAFSLAISPFARLGPDEDPLPIVDLGQLGPVRCNRCKAYMNPYMQFVDGGRRIQCCFCGCHTDVPPEYFAHLDHTGRRIDTDQRPELCLGAYEFIATTDYCKNNTLPKPPAFIFMIDVSYNAVKSGLVQLLCDHLKDDILANLPREYGMEESEIRVGFVTYAKELQFYNVKGTLAQPQMLVVSDVQDVFVPLLDGFLVKLSESEAVIDTLLAQIPQMFAESRDTEIVLGPVIQAGLDALKAADCAGKLFIFHTSLPIADAPGKLKNRDDRKLLGTDKEKTLLTPANNFYTKLGQQCVAAGCGVDLFLFPNSYIDIASIAEVPRLTGGNIYKYSYFQADLDGQRLLEDLKTNVMRPIAFDAIMRVRTSTGIRPVDFLGNFYMANTTDVELATVDCDKTITVEIKHDDKLTEAEGACVQAAVLYTSVSGQRRLRILNMSFNCCTQLADLFKNCELDTFINYAAKLAIRESLNSNPKTVRENLMNRCAQILACYRKNCASPSSAGQLILPECMKLLPLYTNCIVKSHVLQGGTEVATDERSYLIHAVNAMSVKDTQVFFYPRLLPLHEVDLDSECGMLPPAIRCSYERLKDNGVYLIENGLSMLLWLGMNVPQEWIYSLFGVQSVAQINIEKTELQNFDNPISRHVRGVIQKVREERSRYLKLVIVRQRDKLELVFQQYLLEDRNASGGASYVDFLCHIHKEIRSLLS